MNLIILYAIKRFFVTFHCTINIGLNIYCKMSYKWWDKSFLFFPYKIYELIFKSQEKNKKMFIKQKLRLVSLIRMILWLGTLSTGAEWGGELVVKAIWGSLISHVKAVHNIALNFSPYTTQRLESSIVKDKELSLEHCIAQILNLIKR